MNSNTSFGDLCCLFCCPPWPSKVVAKLAFLPPQASYQFIKLKDHVIETNLDRDQSCSTAQMINGNGDAPPVPATAAQQTSSENTRQPQQTSNTAPVRDQTTNGQSPEPLNTQTTDDSTNPQNSSKTRRLLSTLNPKNSFCAPKSSGASNVSGNGNCKFQAPPSPPFEYKLQPNCEPDGHIPYVFDDRQIQPFFVKSKRGNKVACTYIRYTASRQQYQRNPSKFVILFSHGNAVDIGQMPPFYLTLAAKLKTDIFSYDYSGYGLSTGNANEANLYTDIRAAYKALKEKFNYKDRQIILYGQSIGTVPTIDLASSPMGKDVAAVVLHSPLLSGIRVIVPNAKKTSYCFDPFPSIDKVAKISSNVLVIHGTEDEVIDFTHGLQIYDLATKTMDPLWVEGAGHNDIEYFPAYLQRLIKLIEELGFESEQLDEEQGAIEALQENATRERALDDFKDKFQRRVTPHKIKKTRKK